MLGGVCVNTGTIPSKTLREAVMYLTGMNQRELYGAELPRQVENHVDDLHERTAHVVKREIDVIRDQLVRNRVDLFTGHGRFVDEHTVGVDGPDEAERRTVTADYIVIASGTAPRRPEGVAFDDDRVLDSDEIIQLKSIPTSMVVVGAGVIGIEYASIFAALGTKVTVVEKRDSMLDFCDPEIVEALRFHLRDLARDVPFRRGGDRRRACPDRHADHAGQRKRDRSRGRHVLGRPSGPHRGTRPRQRRPSRRRPRSHRGRRAFPHQDQTHLQCR